MVTIEVTQGDIDAAIQTIENDHRWDVCKVCPIARALNRILPSSKATWHVGEHAILRSPSLAKDISALLPKAADEWRDKFDTDFDNVKPFAFEINIDASTVPP